MPRKLPRHTFDKANRVAKTKKREARATIDRRRAAKDRRQTADRRQRTEPVVVERRQLERRAKVVRRRQIDPTTCERDYSNEEVEFMHALDAYKRSSGRMFPTCSEVLEVLTKLGYRKVAPATDPTIFDDPPQPSPASEFESL
jgi:hypothetical protein